MPAVLIETSFRNQCERCETIRFKEGLRALGKAIGEAVIDYVKQSKALGRK